MAGGWGLTMFDRPQLTGDTQPPRRLGLLASVSASDALAVVLFALAAVGLWYAPADVRPVCLFLAGYALGRLRFARAS